MAACCASRPRGRRLQRLWRNANRTSLRCDERGLVAFLAASPYFIMAGSYYFYSILSDCLSDGVGWGDACRRRGVDRIVCPVGGQRLISELWRVPQTRPKHSLKPSPNHLSKRLRIFRVFLPSTCLLKIVTFAIVIAWNQPRAAKAPPPHR